MASRCPGDGSGSRGSSDTAASSATGSKSGASALADGAANSQRSSKEYPRFRSWESAAMALMESPPRARKLSSAPTGPPRFNTSAKTSQSSFSRGEHGGRWPGSGGAMGGRAR